MPEAQPADVVRAQVVLANKTALPRDAVTNTFHFWCPGGATEGNVSAIRTLLQAFYNTAPNNNYPPICYYLSASVDRTKPVEVRCYDLGDPVTHDAQGHVTQTRPLHLATFTLGPISGGSTGKLPDEVALTLSYFADRNAKRHRGRLFIGPLDRVAMDSNQDGDARPVDGILNGIKESAAALALQSTQEGIKWGLYSTTDAVLRYPITGLWVDNAFDTVRKRGLRASARASASL